MYSRLHADIAVPSAPVDKALHKRGDAKGVMPRSAKPGRMMTALLYLVRWKQTMETQTRRGRGTGLELGANKARSELD